MNKKKIPYRQTPAYRERLEIGQAVASLMPQYATQQEVAKTLGISRTRVAEIEALALHKLFKRVHCDAAKFRVKTAA